MFIGVNSRCAHQVRQPPGRFAWCSTVGKYLATSGTDQGFGAEAWVDCGERRVMHVGLIQRGIPP
jgi:hypothetical protein